LKGCQIGHPFLLFTLETKFVGYAFSHFCREK
jgi:hypothetical protein